MTRRGQWVFFLLLALSFAASLAVNLINRLSDSRLRTCTEQLKDIEGAKEQFALEQEGAAPESFASLIPDYLKNIPVCPSGGTYDMGTLQEPAQCNFKGHEVLWP
jgi:hypothetical protein